jgi:hypothetical protein
VAPAIEVCVSGPAVLVLCHDDLGDGRELAERVRPRLVPTAAVLVLDLHGLRRLGPAAVEVLAELADQAREAAIAVRIVGDDERVLEAVRAARDRPGLTALWTSGTPPHHPRVHCGSITHNPRAPR